MDPLTIVFIITALAGVAGEVVSSVKDNKIQKAIKELAEDISQDSALLTKLRDAYNRKDGQLANEILTYSPYSTAYKKIKNRVMELNDTYDATSAKLAKSIDKANTQYTNLLNRTGSQGTYAIKDTSAAIEASKLIDTINQERRSKEDSSETNTNNLINGG